MAWPESEPTSRSSRSWFLLVGIELLCQELAGTRVEWPGSDRRLNSRQRKGAESDRRQVFLGMRLTVLGLEWCISNESPIRLNRRRKYRISRTAMETWERYIARRSRQMPVPYTISA